MLEFRLQICIYKVFPYLNGGGGSKVGILCFYGVHLSESYIPSKNYSKTENTVLL